MAEKDWKAWQRTIRDNHEVYQVTCKELTKCGMAVKEAKEYARSLAVGVLLINLQAERLTKELSKG
jgi:hypothetical protein